MYVPVDDLWYLREMHGNPRNEPVLERGLQGHLKKIHHYFEKHSLITIHFAVPVNKLACI